MIKQYRKTLTCQRLLLCTNLHFIALHFIVHLNQLNSHKIGCPKIFFFIPPISQNLLTLFSNLFQYSSSSTCLAAIGSSNSGYFSFNLSPSSFSPLTWQEIFGYHLDAKEHLV